MASNQNFSFEFIASSLCKLVALSALTFFLLALFLSNHPSCTPGTEFFSPLRIPWPSSSEPNLIVSSQENLTSSSQEKLVISSNPPTSINHIIFGLVGSTKAWKHRRAYIESWWRANVTRGYLFLDAPPTEKLLPWSPLSPPFKVSDDTTILFQHIAPTAIRIAHAVMEVVREGDEGVRWFVMGDDDSIFIVDNWVDTLSKYDHTKYVYIGGHSESIMANDIHSFEMGFGGAGFAMSYPLAETVAKDLEECIIRYPLLYAADQILMSCIADFGVSANFEKGIHQIDLRGDISGLLSSHPQAPLLSLHHFDYVKPIFPSMSRFNSAKHLMKAANTDRFRLLQQTICHHRPSNWTFSISWGYSAHIYETVIPRSVLKKPLETFKPWVVDAIPPFHLFNTRPLSSNPCEVPHIFSFDSIENSGNEVVTNYVRSASRGLPTCFSSGNQFADYVTKIQVLSPTMKPSEDGKAECCDVLQVGDKGMAKVKIRSCLKDEIIA